MGCYMKKRTKEEMRLYMRAYRKAHPEYRQQADDRGKKRSAELKKWVQSLKASPCLDCGGSFPTECMDFDHVREKKRFNLSARGRYFSKAAIAEEIAKCDLVCANCHRIRTRLRSVNAARAALNR